MGGTSFLWLLSICWNFLWFLLQALGGKKRMNTGFMTIKQALMIVTQDSIIDQTDKSVAVPVIHHQHEKPS